MLFASRVMTALLSRLDVVVPAGGADGFGVTGTEGKIDIEFDERVERIGDAILECGDGVAEAHAAIEARIGDACLQG
jgi:hypothetical protein